MYCMNLNVAYQDESMPDPVNQLRQLYDDWRGSRVGKPDGVQSVVTITPAGTDHDMRIQLLDWQRLPVASGVATVSVTHEPDSARVTSIGAPTDLGNGLFSVLLSPGGGTGTDRFRVVADDGVKQVVLTPSPQLCIDDPCVCDPTNPANPRPGAVTDLRVGRDGSVTWTAASESTTSNLHSGALEALLADRAFARTQCIASDLASPTAADSRPLPGGVPNGYYYLAGGRSPCGDGPMGSTSLGAARDVPACP
jgi:hypothetical protein